MKKLIILMTLFLCLPVQAVNSHKELESQDLNDKGKVSFNILVNSSGLTCIDIKNGNSNVYSIISLGMNPVSQPFRFSYGFGFGTQLLFTEKFYSNIELYFYQINNGDFFRIDNSNMGTLRLTGGLKIFENIAVIGGLSLNILFLNNYQKIGFNSNSFINNNIIFLPGIFTGVEI